jgi:Ca2+-binding EF-hand superfamily protein
MMVNNNEELKNDLAMRKNGGINYYIERELKNILDIMLTYIKQKNIMIDMIKKSIDFNIDKLISDIDFKALGYIDITSIIDFLKKYNKYNLNTKDAIILINEIDTDRDGIISYQDIRRLLKLENNSDNYIKSSHYNYIVDDNREHHTTSTFSERKYLSYKNNNDSDRLKKFFKNLIKLENIVEKHRIDLIYRDDISISNILSAFEIQDNHIHSNQLQYFMTSNKICCSNHEFKLFFNRYDCDKDGRLSLVELSNIFISKNEDLAKLIRERDKSLDLSNISKTFIIDLFRIIINSELKIDKLKKDFTYDDNLLTEFFNFIKSDFRTYITLQDLKIFLPNESDNEIYLLFDRFDKDKDFKINLEEVNF